MAIITNRIQPRLQVQLVSAMGWKYSQHAQLVYKSGVTSFLRLRLANHANYPAAGIYPLNTGRITVTVADAYWQTDKLQLQQVLNSNPHSLTPWDDTTDGSFQNMHGYQIENIPAGAWRDFLVRVNGVALTFDDVGELLTFLYPSPA